MDGTRLPETCGGACVHVFLRAEDIPHAVEFAENELLADKYMPASTYEAIELEFEEFDNEPEDDGYPAGDDLEDILNNGGVWYGPFSLYPPNEGR